jgi:two-component system OmpR family response regulator
MEQDPVASRKVGTAVHVLLIGSYPPLTRALRQALEEEGFTVDVACPGDERVVAVAAAEVDAIVLDRMRPGEPNLSTVRSWRQLRPRAPVLLLASPDGPGDLAQAISDWLAKPFDVDAFLDRLRALIHIASIPTCPALDSGDLLATASGT